MGHGATHLLCHTQAPGQLPAAAPVFFPGSQKRGEYTHFFYFSPSLAQWVSAPQRVHRYSLAMEVSI